jgi:hypothetical protein
VLARFYVSSRHTVAACAAVCLLLLSACSHAHRSAGTVEHQAGTERVQNRWPVGGEWRYSAPWAEARELSSDQYDLWQSGISECMKASGFDYTPQRYFDTDDVYALLNPLNEAELFLGYKEPPQQAPKNPNAKASSQDYDQALVGKRGGCADRSRSFVYGGRSGAAVSQLQNTLVRSADQAIAGYAKTGDAQKRLDSWHSCMRAGGFDFASPDAARASFSGDGSPSRKELDVRKADFKCDVATGLTESRSRFETPAFSAWLDQNAVAVKQLTDLESQAVREVVILSAKLSKEHDTALPTIDPAGNTTASTLPEP